MTKAETKKAISSIEKALKIVRAKDMKSEAYRLLVHAKAELVFNHG